LGFIANKNLMITMDIQYFIIYPKEIIMDKSLEKIIEDKNSKAKKIQDELDLKDLKLINNNKEKYINDIMDKNKNKDWELITFDQLCHRASSDKAEDLNIKIMTQQDGDNIKSLKNLCKQEFMVEDLYPISKNFNPILSLEYFLDEPDGNLYYIDVENHQYSSLNMKNYLKLLDNFDIYDKGPVNNIRIVNGCRLIKVYIIDKNKDDKVKNWLLNEGMSLLTQPMFLYKIGIENFHII
jgi:hypothetical protein